MVNSCAVYECNEKKNYGNNEKFYRFPSVSGLSRSLKQQRRIAWYNALKRKDFKLDEVGSKRICSKHFLSGKPASIDDISNVDWIPCVNMGHSEGILESRRKINEARSYRIKQRTQHAKQQTLKKVKKVPRVHNVKYNSDVGEKLDSSNRSTTTEIEEDNVGTNSVMTNTNLNDTCTNENELELINSEQPVESEILVSEQNINRRRTIESQTDFSFNGADISVFLQEIYRLQNENRIFKEEIALLTLDEVAFVNNDAKVIFFTGLPNYRLLKLIFNEAESALDTIKMKHITNFQKLIIALLKIRSNTSFKSLGYRFKLGGRQVSKIFFGVITTLNILFRHFIHWPDRNSLQLLVPQSFEERFGNKVAVIIDCFEIATERPSTLKARNETFSNYKQKNTAKYLIGITPQGVISFISKGYGGRVSDRVITEDCGILNNLLPGDIILADRGFTVHELVSTLEAELKIPAFKSRKDQFHPREIAAVRIHIERVISCIRQRYKILNGPIPVYMLNKKVGDEGLLDIIVRVSCALTNLCESIVSL